MESETMYTTAEYENSYKTAVVLIPPPEVWGPIQAIRGQYDSKIRRWMPHITLIYPFYPLEKFAEVKTIWSETCRWLEPFTVKLSQFLYFRHPYHNYTLWLAPEPKGCLVSLYQRLRQVLPDKAADLKKETGKFEPHLSVGQVKGKEKMDNVRQQLQTNWQELQFTVQEIALIYRHDPPDDVFQIHSTIRLEGKK